MKKLLALLLSLLVLASCNGPDQPAKDEEPEPQDQPAKLEPEDEEAKDQLWDFSVKTMEEIRSSSNSFYSPMSLYLALDMLREGASDESLEELNQLMGSQIDPRALIDYLSLDEENSQSLIANSLWVQEGFKIKEDFQKKLEEDHGAQAENLDLSLQASMDLIRAWIKENTKGRIDPELSAEANMALYLVNTLYLKSTWMEPFYEENTKEGSFKGLEEELKVDFMEGTSDEELYFENDKFQLARKSLEGGLEAYFIKPKEMELKELSYKEILESMDEMTPHMINWTMPKVHLDYEMELNSTLQELGLETIFERDGKLGGISEEILNVSLIKQWSDLLIEEDGIEAAAATMIGVRMAMDPVEYPQVDMVLDSPYSVLILYKDLPLFMGEVYKPA